MGNNTFIKILLLTIFAHSLLFYGGRKSSEISFSSAHKWATKGETVKVIMGQRAVRLANKNGPSISQPVTQSQATLLRETLPSTQEKVNMGVEEFSLEGLHKQLTNSDKILLPEYTWQAYELKLRGKVLLRIVLDADGRPTKVEDLSPELPQLLRDLSVEVARQWFLPSFKNREIKVAFDFRPED